MSSITEIESEDAFQTQLSSLPSSTLVVLNFHTPWAAPCAQMKTILETLASTYPPQSPPTISFLSVNAEDLPDISESYDVTAVPFLVLQRDSKTLESVSGCDAAKVRAAVERHVQKEGGKQKYTLPEALKVTRRDKEDSNTDDMSNANGSSNVTKDLSSYAPDSKDPTTAPQMSSSGAAQAGHDGPLDPEKTQPENDTEALNKRISELVKAAPVMLFMKGTPSVPQCGFSRSLVGILRENGVRYGFFNILADEDIRQGLKVWADWPTFPQLWVGGELVGGLDIVKEELENDPDFFKDYSVGSGKGGMTAPEAQKKPEVAAS